MTSFMAPSMRLRRVYRPSRPGISPARKVGRNRNSASASTTPSTAAMAMTAFCAFSLPSFFSSQRSSLVGSSCSSSGRRLAE